MQVFKLFRAAPKVPKVAKVGVKSLIFKDN
jgi:hypothetical protein